MPMTLTNTQIQAYTDRINTGGLQAAIQVYAELYAKGYNYAGWASGVATGSTVTGVSALSYLSSTALMGIGSDACRNLSQTQIDKIRVDMAKGYLTSLQTIANAPGNSGIVSRDVEFKEAQTFHQNVFTFNGLGIANWTLETPMSLIRKTEGDAAVESIWQKLRDTGGDGADSLIASTLLAQRVGRLSFSSDPVVASAAQAWMNLTPGFANISQIGNAINSIIATINGGTSTDPMGSSDFSSIVNSVAALSVTPNASGGATAIATIRNSNGTSSVYNIQVSPLGGATNGNQLNLGTTTNTQTGAKTYQLTDAKGVPFTGSANVATNGNISFIASGTTYIVKDGVVIANYTPATGIGQSVGGQSVTGYNPTTGALQSVSNSIGGVYVQGYSATSTSANGSTWGAPQIAFTDSSAANNADYAAWHAFGNGTLSKNDFQNIVNTSTSYSLTSGTTITQGGNPNDIYNPIGAFYESRSAANDPALSIANKTFRILNASGQGVTTAQLTAADANRDGKLSGAELSGLTAWSDLNEDGTLATNELTTLAAALTTAGLTSLSAKDYATFTAGNAIYKTSGVAAGQAGAIAPALTTTAPAALASNFATLRATDNRYILSANQYGASWIDWQPGHIKINQGTPNSLIGTNGNDNMDAANYARYLGSLSIYFNLNLLTNFYAGGGDDVFGGSSRSDNIWGGTGNDVLFGYAGDDKVYGEEGNDQIQGGAGNDTLDGGIGADRLFGEVGNDTLVGGDGDDIMLGFTASNDAKQTLAAGESDNDLMYGGAGADQMYGGLGNDVMSGDAGNDVVSGDAGDDTLFGGAGLDEITGGTGNDTLDGGLEADKLFGGVGNDTLYGGDGDDILLGFTPSNDAKQTLAAGETDNDLLYGGAGNDLIIAGLGDDQAWGGMGTDEIQGGQGNDQLYGEDGADRLFGGAGDDTIYGGAGDDLIYGGVATNETALAAGTADNNFLYGGAGADTVVGGIGADFMDGGAGADYMEGGKGDDTYIVNSVNDVILELQNEGYDTVIASTNYILNTGIEELRLTEGGQYNGTGNSLNNKIIGNSQDNILDGVTGADTMIGGLGNDTYYVDNTGDQVIELAGEGVDTVNSSISYTLGANVENLTLLDFSKAEKGIADGKNILVYGYPKAFELDYMQGNAVAGYKGTCALVSIANLATQANQQLTEASVVNRAITNGWAVTSSTVTDYQRGGSNYIGQQALLNSYGIRNGIVMGYNETGLANLIKGGRGVIVAVNAGKLWSDSNYTEGGGVNHVVTLTGVACDAATGAINGFYIADSGRGKVSDMTRYISIADFRASVQVANAYAIYTVDPIKLWEENVNAAGNELDNVITGNRGNNILTGNRGNDTLIGQAGDDTYQFNRGDGTDTIIDSDSTAGNLDILQLGASINQNNLWLKHVGTNLQISIMGTADQIILKDWYLTAAANTGNTNNQIERIKTADGKTMWNTDVEKLVQAMAAFAPPAAATTSWISGATQNGQTLLAVAR